MKLVFVYLGKKLPKYALANINQIRSRFPDREVVFIGDDSPVCKKVERKGITTWLSPAPEVNWVLNRDSLSHNPNFRDGFWFKTLARFYSLNEYLKNFPSESALLIESDVWISPNFPFAKFDEGQFDCAYPLSGQNIGVASTFFIRNSFCMQIFLDFAEQKAKGNPEETDVSILGNFYHVRKINTVILPTAINSESSFNSTVSEQESALLSSQSYFKDGIFDASTWGQYLTGLDPRNAWGFRKVYFRQQHHSVNPSNFFFKNKGEGVSVGISGQSKNLYSLHVHSKDIRVFRDGNFLSFRVAHALDGPRTEGVPKYVIRFFPSRVFQFFKDVFRRSGVLR